MPEHASLGEMAKKSQLIRVGILSNGGADGISLPSRSPVWVCEFVQKSSRVSLLRVDISYT